MPRYNLIKNEVSDHISISFQFRVKLLVCFIAFTEFKSIWSIFGQIRWSFSFVWKNNFHRRFLVMLRRLKIIQIRTLLLVKRCGATKSGICIMHFCTAINTCTVTCMLSIFSLLSKMPRLPYTYDVWETSGEGGGLMSQALFLRNEISV